MFVLAVRPGINFLMLFAQESLANLISQLFLRKMIFLHISLLIFPLAVRLFCSLVELCLAREFSILH